MSAKGQLFEEFIIKQCEEVLKDNDQYKELRDKNINEFNKIRASLDQKNKELLFEYEESVTHLNDILLSTACRIIKGLYTHNAHTLDQSTPEKESYMTQNYA